MSTNFQVSPGTALHANTPATIITVKDRQDLPADAGGFTPGSAGDGPAALSLYAPTAILPLPKQSLVALETVNESYRAGRGWDGKTAPPD